MKKDLRINIWVNGPVANDYRQVDCQIEFNTWEQDYENIYAACEKEFPELSVEQLGEGIHGYGIVSVQIADATKSYLGYKTLDIDALKPNGRGGQEHA